MTPAIITRPEDEAEMLETESNTVASFPEYRRMVTEMITWWKEHYSEAYEVLLFELSDTERNDKRLHYFGAIHDIRYNLLEPRWMQIFMSGAKKWKDEAKTIQYSYDTPRKYHDLQALSQSFPGAKHLAKLKSVAKTHGQA